jgi:hypothetical protein
MLGGAALLRDPSPPASGSGYVTMVNSFFLKPRPPLLVRDPAGDNFAARTSAGWDKDHTAFARDSWLLSDLASNDAGIWVIKNGELKAMAESRLATRRIADQSAAWNGSLLFRAPVQLTNAELLEAPIEIAVTAPDGAEARIALINSRNDPGETLVLNQLATQKVNDRFDLACSDFGKAGIRIRRDGNAILVQQINDESPCQIRLNDLLLAGLTRERVWPAGMELNVNVPGKGLYRLRHLSRQQLQSRIAWRGRDGQRRGLVDANRLGLAELAAAASPARGRGHAAGTADAAAAAVAAWHTAAA